MNIHFDVQFCEYDVGFRDASFDWLQDDELRALINAPRVSKREQCNWFASLSGRLDYKIWGVLVDGIPAGACGLKKITSQDAEYWGYLGRRELWGHGIGMKMVNHCVSQACSLQLGEVWLVVRRENKRAIALYEKTGFIEAGSDGVDCFMKRKLRSV